MPQDQYSTVVLPPVAVADDADQIFEERALAVQLGQSHVDYLSHALDERDLQKSWRYANKHRDLIFNGRRLENASWRRWFQEKFHLRKLDPADLNWSKDSDITWLYGPIFNATAPDLPPLSRPPSSHLPDMHPTRSADIPLASLAPPPPPTPSSGPPGGRYFPTSPSSPYPDPTDASARPPRLKPALKRRDPADILSVIRREREWLTQGAVDDAPYVAPNETSAACGRMAPSAGLSVDQGRPPLQKSRSSTDFSSGARGRYTSTVPPPATVTPTSAGAPSSHPVPVSRAPSLRRVPSVGSAGAGAHRVVSLASMGSSTSTTGTGTGTATGTTGTASASASSLAGRRSVSEASLGESAARHIRFNRRVEKLFFDAGEARTMGGSRSVGEGGEGGAVRFISGDDPASDDEDDEDQGVVMAAKAGRHLRRGSVGAGKLLRRTASAADVEQRGGLVAIRQIKSAAGFGAGAGASHVAADHDDEDEDGEMVVGVGVERDENGNEESEDDAEEPLLSFGAGSNKAASPSPSLSREKPGAGVRHPAPAVPGTPPSAERTVPSRGMGGRAEPEVVVVGFVGAVGPGEDGDLLTSTSTGQDDTSARGGGESSGFDERKRVVDADTEGDRVGNGTVGSYSDPVASSVWRRIVDIALTVWDVIEWMVLRWA